MIFREMRRKKQQLDEKECVGILESSSTGVLALMGDGGYPYAVPLNYVYYDGAVYIHCAKSGHKLDAIKACDRVSFCVIEQDTVVPQEYATYYRSVIVFGRAAVMDQDDEIRSAIERLALKYAPDDSEENRRREIERDYSALCMVKIEIEHMTGKEALGLAKRRAARP